MIALKDISKSLSERLHIKPTSQEILREAMTSNLFETSSITHFEDILHELHQLGSLISQPTINHTFQTTALQGRSQSEIAATITAAVLATICLHKIRWEEHHDRLLHCAECLWIFLKRTQRINIKFKDNEADLRLMPLFQDLLFILIKLVKAAPMQSATSSHLNAHDLLQIVVNHTPAHRHLLQAGGKLDLILLEAFTLPVDLVPELFRRLWADYPCTSWEELAELAIDPSILVFSWQSLKANAQSFCSQNHTLIPVMRAHVLNWQPCSTGPFGVAARFAMACGVLMCGQTEFDTGLVDIVQSLLDSACINEDRSVLFKQGVLQCALLVGLDTVSLARLGLGYALEKYVQVLHQSCLQYLLTLSFLGCFPPLFLLAGILGRQCGVLLKSSSCGKNTDIETGNWLDDLIDHCQSLKKQFISETSLQDSRYQLRWEACHLFLAALCDEVVGGQHRPEQPLLAQNTKCLLKLLSFFPPSEDQQDSLKLLLTHLQKTAEENGAFYSIIDDFPSKADLFSNSISEPQKDEPVLRRFSGHRLQVYAALLQHWLHWVALVPNTRAKLHESIIGTLLGCLCIENKHLNSLLHRICRLLVLHTPAFEGILEMLCTAEEAQSRFASHYIKETIKNFPDSTSFDSLSKALGIIIGVADETKKIKAATAIYAVQKMMVKCEHLWVASQTFPVTLKSRVVNVNENKLMVLMLVLQALKLCPFSFLDTMLQEVKVSIIRIAKLNAETRDDLFNLIYHSIGFSFEDTRQSHLFNWFLQLNLLRSKL